MLTALFLEQILDIRLSGKKFDLKVPLYAYRRVNFKDTGLKF